MKIAVPLVVLALTASMSCGQNQAATLVNGVDGYLSVAANPSLVPASAITVEAWVLFINTGLNPTNLYPTILRKNIANGQEEYFLRVQGTGALRWKIKTSATTSLSVDSPTPMPGGVWTHVAGTYDGSAARLFINGIQVAQAVGAGAPYNGGGALRIGKGDDQGGLPSEVWSGSIDELRIWSVARSGAQIQSTMPWQLPPTSNLVSAWRMTGNALDSVGANHGAVAGSVAFGPATLPLQTGPPPWQVNQAAISLDINGTSSDGYSPGVETTTFTPCAAANVVVNLTMSPPAPWNVGITLIPGVPAGSGGIVTPGGQVVNLNLSDPAFTLLFPTGFGPPTSSIAIPVSFNAPFMASIQAVVLDPLSPAGFSLSSMVELHVVPGATLIPGPAADDSVVTVSLANPALCGAPPSFPFFNNSYTQFDVSSNGRVLFGSPVPNTAFTPSAAAAATGDPFVGAWCDLAPNLAGTISISSPSSGFIRVDWVGVRYYAVASTVTFGIQLDGTSGAIQIDGLGGMTPASLNQFLGITAGSPGPATDAGATAFVLGGPFTPPNGLAMIYAFGSAGSLSPGLSTIVFVPAGNGGYSWAAF